MNFSRVNIHTVLLIAGFVWGLAGFTFELTGAEDGLAATLVRSIFVAIGTFLCFPAFDGKLNTGFKLPLFLFFLYFFAFILSSVINSFSLAEVLRETGVICAVMIFAVLASRPDRIYSFVGGLYAASVLILLYSISQIDVSSLANPLYRLEAVMGSNGLAAVAVVSMLISVYRLSSSPERLRRYVYWFVVICAVIILIATKSRTAIVMLLAAYFAISILTRRYRNLVFVGGALVIVIVLVPDLLDIVLRMNVGLDAEAGRNFYNLTGRIAVWRVGLDMFLDNPFFGVGPENAFVVVDGVPRTFHNAYLQLLVATGLFGFLPVLGILVLATRGLVGSDGSMVIKALFVAGLVGAMAESRLLNYGSPANALLLVSIVYLSGVHSSELKQIAHTTLMTRVGRIRRRV